MSVEQKMIEEAEDAVSDLRMDKAFFRDWVIRLAAAFQATVMERDRLRIESTAQMVVLIERLDVPFEQIEKWIEAAKPVPTPEADHD